MLSIYTVRYAVLFLLAGSTVVGVTILADRGLTNAAGLLVFAPIVSLFSFIGIASSGREDVLVEVAWRSALAAPAVLIYAISVSVLVPYLGSIMSILTSVAIWFLVAFLTTGLLK